MKAKRGKWTSPSLEARDECWYGSIYGTKTKGMEGRSVSRCAPLSTGKFASRLFNAAHPFLVPKEQQDRYSKKKARKNGFRCFSFASLALPFGSPSRNLYIDRIVFFSPFFRFRIKKSCQNIWTIERETKDSKRCSLKSFFKDNEKTKDLFPRVIRKISEKKNSECEKFQRQLGCFVVVCFDFSSKSGREARLTDCFEMFEIPLLIEDKPGDSRTTVKRAQLDYSLVIPLSRTSRPLVITIKVLITFKLARPSGCLEFRIVIWIGPWTRLGFSMKRLRDFAYRRVQILRINEIIVLRLSLFSILTILSWFANVTLG